MGRALLPKLNNTCLGVFLSSEREKKECYFFQYYFRKNVVCNFRKMMIVCEERGSAGLHSTEQRYSIQIFGIPEVKSAILLVGIGQ